MRLARLAVVITISAVTVACGYSNGTSPSTGPSAVPSPTSGPSSSVSIPRGAESLGNRAFAPDELSVPEGTTVTWTNTDSESHTSTSDTTTWNSGTIAPGGRFSLTFDKVGTFRYHCAIPPGMVGTVVVQ